MITRTRLGLVLTTASLLAPLNVQAATELDALNACASALAAEIGETQGAPVGYRFSEGTRESSVLLKGITTFYLDATSPQSGEIVARADCRVDAAGEVRDLRQLHLNSSNARVRSQVG
jgi:hypothetical protein